MRKDITAITTPELMRRKKALEAKMRDLLGTSVAREDLQIEHLAEPLDQIKSNLDREMALRRLDNNARLIQNLQLALEAVEDGSYGVCESCDKPIPPRRLDAVPWARLCVPCQSAAEATGEEPEELVAFTHAA